MVFDHYQDIVILDFRENLRRKREWEGSNIKCKDDGNNFKLSDFGFPKIKGFECECGLFIKTKPKQRYLRCSKCRRYYKRK